MNYYSLLLAFIMRQLYLKKHYSHTVSHYEFHCVYNTCLLCFGFRSRNLTMIRYLQVNSGLSFKAFIFHHEFVINSILRMLVQMGFYFHYPLKKFYEQQSLYLEFIYSQVLNLTYQSPLNAMHLIIIQNYCLKYLVINQEQISMCQMKLYVVKSLVVECFKFKSCFNCCLDIVTILFVIRVSYFKKDFLIFKLQFIIS